MTWGLQQRDFPILTPGQMNPFNQAFQSGLQTYGDVTKASYLKPQMEADINYKNTLAQMQPYNYLSKALSDPFIVAQMAKNPEQFDKIINTMSNIPVRGADQPHQQNNSQPGFLTQLWNKVTGQENQMPVQNTPENNASPPQSFNANPQANDPLNSIPKNQQNYATPYSPTPSGSINLADPSMNAAHYDYSQGGKYPELNIKMAKLNPSQEQKNAEQQQKEEVTAQSELWKDRMKEEGKKVDSNQDALTTVRSMKSLYDDLNPLEKGVVFGKGPAVSSGAQSLDRLAKVQSTQNIRALQSQHITNADFIIGDKLKANRGLNEASFKEAIAYSEALSLRGKQRQRFMAEAKKHMPIEQADMMWSNFIEQHPLFNTKTQKLIPENYKISPFNTEKNNAGSYKGGSPATGNDVPPNEEGALITTDKKGNRYKRIGNDWIPL